MKKRILIFFLLSLWSCLALGESSEDMELSSSPSEKIKKMKVKEVSDLSRLSPFDDIAVIQKRFLQKTGRWESGVSLMSILNNKFFYLMGGSLRLGYFIREKHGLGLLGYGVIYYDKLFASQLQGDPNRITAFNYIAPRFFGGIYYRWTPVYGKFSFLNTQIHYFDMSFDLGLGATNIISAIKNKNIPADWTPTLPVAPTLRLSAGQVFALDKNKGVSWDVTYYLYIYDLKNRQGETQRQDAHDLSLSFGFNYYFPEVRSR